MLDEGLISVKCCGVFPDWDLGLTNFGSGVCQSVEFGH